MGDDGRCGPNYQLPNGDPGQCDPSDKKHCCSDAGWCGNGRWHCLCPKCVRYGAPSGMTICPNMKVGDATGGKEIKIGSYTLSDCISKCKEKTDVMGVTTTSLVDDKKSGNCYCEYGVTGQNGSKGYKTCFLP